MTTALTSAVPSAERSVRQLELMVTRRLDGLLHGEYRGLLPGPGSELNDGRPYELGDDVRRIDWSLSARCGHTHVRDTIADRELETWAVIDGSASMDFGTDEWEKRSLAIATVAAFGFLSSMGGSRFGAVIAEPSGVTVHPAASGRDQLRRLLLTLERRPLAGTGTTDLGPAIERIRRIGRRPGAVVLISDLLGPDDWQRPMRALGANAKTIVAEIKDRREDELPPVGLLTLVDPETGRLREVQTSNRHVRARYAVAAQQRRSDMKRNVRSAGADHLVLSTNRDWLGDIVRYHLDRKRIR
ncbi:MAG: DUF58 domain-containing protein [Acidimicrobiales bacterium]